MQIRVGGVPEHFNLAWHLAIENGWFAKEGLQIAWHDVPGGTGAMCKALRNNELDIAIALTEGIIADIAEGNPSKVVQFYVNSPLRWGIYAAPNSAVHTTSQMHRKRYAISRYQSGSHLMAYVNAQANNLTIQEQDFVVVGNLDGARKALANGEADLFLWEKFTTKPYVDSGEFSFIGECKTPWPCFVVAATDSFIQQYPKALQQLLSVINLSCLMLKNNGNAPTLISTRYGIKLSDAQLWFAELEYAAEPAIHEPIMNTVLQSLRQFQILKTIPPIAQICYEPNIVAV